MQSLLNDSLIEQVLDTLPGLRVGVLGDLFLDRYLDLEEDWTEPSVETGLDAYQVYRVRGYPGAAGTVINNLAALGVGTILPISIIGDDGEGLELSRALTRLGAVRPEQVFVSPTRFTPTYTKPMLGKRGRPGRELNRIDIKNRIALPVGDEEQLLRALEEVWPRLDALAVLDQVSEEDCGVVTRRVREKVAALGTAEPGKVILADSRERIGAFRQCAIKPNQGECLRAAGGREGLEEAVTHLARQAGRPVFCTRGEQGILIGDALGRLEAVPAYEVNGPVDTVGAGDSTTAGLLCGLAAGWTAGQAAALGNLVASITVQQMGTTGTASPEQVRQRWAEVR